MSVFCGCFGSTCCKKGRSGCTEVLSDALSWHMNRRVTPFNYLSPRGWCPCRGGEICYGDIYREGGIPDSHLRECDIKTHTGWRAVHARDTLQQPAGLLR